MITQPDTSFVLAAVAIMAAAAILVFESVELVGPDQRCVVVVSGEVRSVLDPGVNVVVPFVSETTTVDVGPQQFNVTTDAITRDGTAVTAAATVEMRVVDPEQTYAVEDYSAAVEDLAQTTVRAVLGDTDTDDAVDAQHWLAEEMRDLLDEHTREWGISIESLDLERVTSE